jgi:hypothetical protein
MKTVSDTKWSTRLILFGIAPKETKSSSNATPKERLKKL